MKKIIILLLAGFLVLGSGVFSHSYAAAETEDGNGASEEVTAVEVKATKEMLDLIDPLRQPEVNSPYADQFSTPGGIITRVMSYAFPLAGMILFVMIVIGGLQMILGGGEQKAVDEGRQRVTFAIIGFIVLFSSYWVAQILETLFNIKIL